MSVGSGIFLSTIAICLLLLYRWTRDRWNWRTVLLRTAIFVGLCGLVGGTITFAYVKYANHISKQTTYSDVRLGMTQTEVLYVKGVPDYVLEEPKEDPLAEKFPGMLVIQRGEIPKNKRTEDYSDWGFNLTDDSGNLTVSFSPISKKVMEVRCYSPQYSCAPIQSLKQGATEEEIVEILGKPVREQIHGVSKTLEYTDLNLSLWLVKKRFYMLAVKDFGAEN